ncbi:MAG: hypothetical protein VXY16_06415 [Pseudomonadota bacterium]|nr:hypothetical protein [Pseudomonadota bacterium]
MEPKTKKIAAISAAALIGVPALALTFAVSAKDDDSAQQNALLETVQQQAEAREQLAEMEEYLVPWLEEQTSELVQLGAISRDFADSIVAEAKEMLTENADEVAQKLTDISAGGGFLIPYFGEDIYEKRYKAFLELLSPELREVIYSSEVNSNGCFGRLAIPSVEETACVADAVTAFKTLDALGENYRTYDFVDSVVIYTPVRRDEGQADAIVSFDTLTEDRLTEVFGVKAALEDVQAQNKVDYLQGFEDSEAAIRAELVTRELRLGMQ